MYVTPRACRHTDRNGQHKFLPALPACQERTISLPLHAPPLKFLSSIHRIPSMSSRGGSSMILYHEVQESKLCGVHCVNTVLQGPFFSELDLAAVAADLDKREMQMGMDVHTHHPHPSSLFSSGLGEEVSSNVSVDGNFSIQVHAQAHSLSHTFLFRSVFF